MKIIDLIKQTLKGKTIYRILMERELQRVCMNMSGQTLDLASGQNPSYMGKMPSKIDFSLTDIKNSKNVSIVDFNKTLPYEDQAFDNVFMINALYIVKNKESFFSEVHRVLKTEGDFLLVSPFISNEMPDPDDFSRFTAQGLSEELKNSNFEILEIKRFGERFSSATYLLEPFWYFRIVKLPVYLTAIIFDKFIPSKIKKLHPAPLGYVCLAKKI